MGHLNRQGRVACKYQTYGLEKSEACSTSVSYIHRLHEPNIILKLMIAVAGHISGVIAEYVSSDVRESVPDVQTLSCISIVLAVWIKESWSTYLVTYHQYSRPLQSGRRL